MKELSIEEKAKRYDEAIKVAKSNYETIVQMDKDCTFAKEVIVNTFHHMFPELKESEDEMTRQEMLAMFSNADDYGLEKEFVKRAIAWLKKQGEQILANPVKTCKDKQKPADKVEPKFNVGDWVVVDNSRTGRIIKCAKYFADVDLEFSRLSTRVNNIRSWTIQDAKDGDVLACENDIVIFKENNYNPKDQSGCMFVYCSCNNFYEIGGINPTAYKPATKEQRDILFQKMHDAGYEWDTKKKELKKIEQKIVDKVEHNVHLTEFEDAVKDMMNDYRYAIGDNDATIDEIKEHAAYLLSLIHQNPDWSEEDKEMLRRCIRATFVHGYLKECNWLKSINERVSNFDDGYKVGFSAAKYNQWKPSDEQMKALKDACDEHWEPDGLDPLYTLLEQLKKLKE